MGNTNARLARETPHGIAVRRSFTVQKLRELGPDIFPAGDLFVCSVIPELTARLQESSGRFIHFASARDDLGFEISQAMKNHGRVGVDRLLGLAGALRLGLRPPLVVVDAGTACTLNVIDDRHRFCGGVIAPGVGAFADYLADRTATLPRLRPRRISTDSPIVGSDTRTAIASAVVHGFPAMVRGLIERIRSEHGGRRLRVAITGGARRLLAESIERVDLMEENLVLYGLADLARKIPRT